jgi:hypothetical protein
MILFYSTLSPPAVYLADNADELMAIPWDGFPYYIMRDIVK